MIVTGDIKSKIDRAWEAFWTGGLTNPISIIEQMNYLIFLKKLDMEEQRFEKNSAVKILMGIKTDEKHKNFPEDKQHLRWNKMIHQSNSGEVHKLFQNEVFEFLKNLHDDEETMFSQYMKNATYQVPTPIVLEKVMGAIEDIFENEKISGKDAMGDLYEYFLSKISTSGKNGQFRTPKHIINMMVALADPKMTETVIDPACGTAGFLASTIEYLRENYGDEFIKPQVQEHFHNNMFHGNDTDPTMLGISAMNLILHGVEKPNLTRIDSMSEDFQEEGKYDIVLANPPFKGSLDESQISGTISQVVKTKKTELLFLALILRLLKIGGRGLVIVPDGVLFGSSTAHKGIRKEIVENHKLQGVISMPNGVFKPYAGVSTGILIFTKTTTGGTDRVWFYNMTSDGYSLDDKRNPITENDIPDIIARWKNKEEETDRELTEKSFFVDIDAIRANDYDLSINRYKEIIHEELTHEKPVVILEQIKKLESEITKGMDELSSMLGEI